MIDNTPSKVVVDNTGYGRRESRKFEWISVAPSPPDEWQKTRTKLVANMDQREWEFFETEVKSDTYHIVDHGPLLGPVTSFKIRRDDRLELVLETASVTSQSADASYPAPNAVNRLDDQVRFQGRYTGFPVTAHGISGRLHLVLPSQ